MLKIVYKWILVIIVALFVAFPLGFIPLKILEGMISNDTAFAASIDEHVIVLYLFFVFISFIGILLAFVISLLIKALVTGEKLKA